MEDSRYKIGAIVGAPCGAMVALAIFTFLGMWNDLFWPLIVLSDREMFTLQLDWL